MNVSSPVKPFKKLSIVFLIPLFTVACFFAYQNHFIMDDAYISMRYAHHFAQGKGLVWSQGSTEFGYTNFLFTLLEGLLMKTGISGEISAFVISVPAYLLSVFLTFNIARNIYDSALAPILCTLAIATHLTFSAFATGGLETSLQACLVLISYNVYIYWQQFRNPKTLVVIGCCSALAALTRLDSVVLLAPLYVHLVWSLIREIRSEKRTVVSAIKWFMIPASIPAITILFFLFICKIYYDQFFPTSFYAKIAVSHPSVWNRSYFLSYASVQAWIPLALLAWSFFCLLWRRYENERYRNILILALPILCWALYVFYVGGDFMEFRLLVPILPFFYLLTGGIILDCSASLRSVVIVFGMVGIGNFAQYQFLKEVVNFAEGQVPTATLNDWVKGAPVNWSIIGEVLHALFYTGNESDVKIAVETAGAIPFYSDLPTVDEYGLNSKGVFNSAFRKNLSPGHIMHSTVNYLQEQKVNLALDLPVYICRKNNREICSHGSISWRKFNSWNFLNRFPLLLIPLENQCYLMGYYVTPHPMIDSLMQKGVIKSFSNIEAASLCGNGGQWMRIPSESEKTPDVYKFFLNKE